MSFMSYISYEYSPNWFTLTTNCLYLVSNYLLLLLTFKPWEWTLHLICLNYLIKIDEKGLFEFFEAFLINYWFKNNEC